MDNSTTFSLLPFRHKSIGIQPLKSLSSKDLSLIILSQEGSKQKRAQIVRDLHIDFRRYRHPNEFLTYFASKFTGVYQYLTAEEYRFLGEQIYAQPDRIKILCLLALLAV